MVIWFFLFFFKQKTAYEMRISDWSSDVCSSDLIAGANRWCQRNRNAAGKDWWFADGLDHCGIPSNAALAEVAVVHDDGQVRAIGGEQFDIAQGIAIDQQQVGERTRRDHAELTLHVQNFGIDRRGGMQDVDRFQDLPAKAELGSDRQSTRLNSSH